MTWADKLNEMRTSLKSLHQATPDTSKGFAALTKAAKGADALDHKTMELIALAIAVADRCEPCIAFHTEALVKMDAPREEVAAMLGICVQMGGGPSLMYAAKTLACYDELAAQ